MQGFNEQNKAGCGDSTHNGLDGRLIDRMANKFPIVLRGTAAPTIIPQVVGDIYVNTSTKKIYLATGISSSSDWTIVN